MLISTKKNYAWGQFWTSSAHGRTGRTSQLLVGMVRGGSWQNLWARSSEEEAFWWETALGICIEVLWRYYIAEYQMDVCRAKHYKTGQKKKKKNNFWGKNNYYGVVSKTVPTAHPWLRSIHIPTNQIGKSSLNTQNIQKRPDYSDSSETMQVRRQWKNL